MGRNNWKQEDADAYDRQAVQDCKEASVRSLQSGQVQCGLGWRGWADDWAVRRRLAEQSLQALEQNDIGRRSHGADQGSAPAYGGMDRCRLHLSQSLQNWWHTSHQVIRCAAAFLVVWPPPVSSRLRRWRSRELMPSSVTAIMVL